MRVDPFSPRGTPSGYIPPPFSTGANAAETSGAAATNTNVPSPTTSDDSDIRRTLDHVVTIQAAQ